jgi:hypothetical protein
MLTTDHRKRLCEEIMHKIDNDEVFSDCVWFSVEQALHLNGILHTYNYRILDSPSPQEIIIKYYDMPNVKV